MAVLDDLTRGIKLDRRAMANLAHKYKNSLSIKAPGIDTSCLMLSGGNRQKVVLAKWLATNPKVLLMNNPTRGIDVGAKREVYKLINELAHHGLGVVMASDELPELLGLSDKLLIMKKGRVSETFQRHQKPTEEACISCML